jgi:signal recognition particle receptor subunit beta
MNQLIKLVISGTMGAGKSTAVAAISAVRPARTEVPIFTGPMKNGKVTTTVGFDYGYLTLADGRIVHIFGTPGQPRYEFMCRMLSRGAIGLVILIDHSSSQNIEELQYFLKLFQELIAETGAVVGVTHTDEAPEKPFDVYYEVLEKSGLFLPVLPVDVREPDHVLLLLETLMTTLEYRGTPTYA